MFNFKKELLGDFVKFSKATAKSNPDMIDREYKRLINDSATKIKKNKEDKRNSFISITIDTVDLKDLVFQDYITESARYHHSLDLHDSYTLLEKKVNVHISQKSKVGKLILNISPKVLDEHRENILKQEKEIEISEEKLNNIYIEYNWFLKNFYNVVFL